MKEKDKQAGEGKEWITLDLPQREGKEGYIGTFLTMYLKMGSVLSDGNFKETDKRIEYMTYFMISLVPGKRDRLEIRERLKKEIEQATKGANGNEEKARLRNMVCLECIGEVTDYVDKHIGVSRENKIGFAW